MTGSVDIHQLLAASSLGDPTSQHLHNRAPHTLTTTPAETDPPADPSEADDRHQEPREAAAAPSSAASAGVPHLVAGDQLVAIGDIAHQLKISQQAVDYWSRKDTRFPAPFQVIDAPTGSRAKGTRVWRKREVDAWIVEHYRRRKK